MTEVEIDELFELEITELRYRGGVSRNMDGSAIASTSFTIVSDDTASWTLSAASSTVAEGDDLPVTITSNPTTADANQPAGFGACGDRPARRVCYIGRDTENITVV